MSDGSKGMAVGIALHPRAAKPLGKIASSYPQEILDIKAEKEGRLSQRARWLERKLFERITHRGRALARSITAAHGSEYVCAARLGCMVKKPLLARLRSPEL
jgi:hypothetical protein